jgi:hypothetical protein
MLNVVFGSGQAGKPAGGILGESCEGEQQAGDGKTMSFHEDLDGRCILPQPENILEVPKEFAFGHGFPAVP